MNGKISIEELDNNLKSKMKDLEKSENTKYSTANGIKEFMCERDGYIDNIYIEGKTLVNLYNIDTTTGIKYENVVKYGNGFTATNPIDYNTNKFNISELSNINISKSKTYTIGMRIKTDKPFNLMIGYYDMFSNGNDVNNLVTINNSGYYYFKRTTLEIPTYNNKFIIGVGGIIKGEENVVQVTDIMIIEGDYIQNPPVYFGSIKSINNIDIITYENLSSDDNLIIKDNFITGGLYWSNGEFAPTSIDRMVSNDYIEVPSDDVILYSNMSNSITICCYDDSKNYLGYSTYFESKYCNNILPNTKYIKILLVDSGPNFDKYKNLYLGYTPLRYNKKENKITLYSLPNGVKDEIVKYENKYYKIKRVDMIELNGSESWSELSGDTNYSYASLKIPDSIISSNTNCFISNMRVLSNNHDKNSTEYYRHIVCHHSDGIYYVTPKVSNIADFKRDLNINRPVVLYQLSKPNIDELNDFNPCVFKGKNMFNLKSGQIQIECDFEVKNSLISDLDELKNKILSVEEDLKNHKHNTVSYRPSFQSGIDTYRNVNIRSVYRNRQTSGGWADGVFFRNNNDNETFLSLYAYGTYSQSEIGCVAGICFDGGDRVSGYDAKKGLYMTKTDIYYNYKKLATAATLSLMEQQVSELELQLLEREV